MSSRSFNNDGNSLHFLPRFQTCCFLFFLPSRRGAVYVYIHIHCKLKLKDTLNIDLILMIDFVLSSYFTTELETRSQMHSAVVSPSYFNFSHFAFCSFKISQSGISDFLIPTLKHLNVLQL